MKGAAPTSLPNIILIGLMGCGKTTIGKELHRETNLGFTDTDQLIERQTGMHIPQIFKIHGESHFRDLETGILQQLQTAAAQSRIISTGGGIIIRPENRLLLKKTGLRRLAPYRRKHPVPAYFQMHQPPPAPTTQSQGRAGTSHE